MSTWVVLVVVVVLLLVGAVRGDRANTQEHAELSTQIQKVYAQVQNVEGDVKGLREEVNGLREETRAGFESLSKQISELNTNRSDGRDDVEN